MYLYIEVPYPGIIPRSISLSKLQISMEDVATTGFCTDNQYKCKYKWNWIRGSPGFEEYGGKGKRKEKGKSELITLIIPLILSQSHSSSSSSLFTLYSSPSILHSSLSLFIFLFSLQLSDFLLWILFLNFPSSLPCQIHCPWFVTHFVDPPISEFGSTVLELFIIFFYSPVANLIPIQLFDTFSLHTINHTLYIAPLPRISLHPTSFCQSSKLLNGVQREGPVRSGLRLLQLGWSSRQLRPDHEHWPWRWFSYANSRSPAYCNL